MIELPNSIESEYALLGAIMLDDSVWPEVGNKLIADHFHDLQNRDMFDAIQSVVRNGDTPDMQLVANSLERKHGKVDRERILSIVHDAGDPMNAKAYTAILAERLLKRKAIAHAEELRAKAYDEASEKADVIESADKLSRALHELQVDSKDPRHMKDIARDTLKQLENRFENQDKLLGKTTGIKELDEATQGLCDGQLVVLAARPGMGKNICLNQFMKASTKVDDAPVVVFSMEMRAEQLAMRYYSDIGSVPFGDLRSGKINREGFAGISSAYEQMRKMNIHVDDTPSQTVFDVSAKAKRMARKYGKLGLICIDYLQLMGSTSHRQDDNARFTEITRTLKVLALELETPIVLLSQLSRAVEQRPNKRPMSSDLRGSGAIEQDADVILMLYRDEYYNPDSPDKGTMEIIRTKVREGEPGTTRVQFLGHFQRICDMPTDYYNTQG
jgi:replicative DNA helicase